MGDWLREYSLADVVPFIEALKQENNIFLMR